MDLMWDRAMRSRPRAGNRVIFYCAICRKWCGSRINDVRVSKLSGKERTYEAEITGQVTEQDKQAPELLRLKKNAQVVMLLNTEKYRNGSTAIVKQLRSREITVKIHKGLPDPGLFIRKALDPAE